MSKRNQGHKLEIITIIINLFCYAYDIFIDYLGEYNKYPVYLPDGNENEPNKKREINVDIFRNYIDKKFGNISYEIFIEKIKEDKSIIEEISKLLNIDSAGSSYKSDFYRGDLGISVKGFGINDKKNNFHSSNVTLINKTTLNGFLKIARRLVKNKDFIKQYGFEEIVTKNYPERVKEVMLDFCKEVYNKKYCKHCQNYKITTNEKGFFYHSEQWNLFMPILVYCAFYGTATGNSFNKASCVLDIIYPFSIKKNICHFQPKSYFDKFKRNFSFEIRGFSEAAYNAYYSEMSVEDNLNHFIFVDWAEKKGIKTLKPYGSMTVHMKKFADDKK